MEGVTTGYKQTEVGVIPEDWNINLISDLSSKIGDGIHSTPVYVNSGKNFFINGNNLVNGQILFFEDTKNVDESEQKKHSRELNNQTILLSINGTIGNVAFYKNENIVIGKSAAFINVKKYLSKQFFYYSIQTSHVQNYFDSNLTGSTIKNLGLSTIRNTPIPLPPTLKEQQAIAQILSDTDELISSLDQLITKKKVIKQGAMQELLTPPSTCAEQSRSKGGKRLPGFSGDWEEKTIDELCKTFTKQTGFDYSNHIKPILLQENRKDTLPFIQNKDFGGIWVNYNTDYYVPRNIAEKFPRILLNERCLMISISGSIGKVGVFNNHNIAFIGGAVAVGKFKNKKLLDWVMFYLQSEKGQAMLLKDVKAGSHQNLILEDIRKMRIPLPPIDEQITIVEMFKSMELEILTLKEKKSKYKQIKQGMMQELLTGKIRVV